MKPKFFFGNKKTSLSWQQRALIDNTQLITCEPFKTIANSVGARQLVFLHQIHSNYGHTIYDQNTFSQSFSVSGDFLITNQKNIGLGVVTADCVPVIAYDEKIVVIGIAHAGWLGVVNGVIENMLIEMQKNYGSKIENMKIICGPSARSCCYEIKEEVLDAIDIKDCLRNGSLVKKDGQYFFDGAKYSAHSVQKCGVIVKNISLTNAVCTICNKEYCSYRREGERAKRNVSVVCLMQ